MFQKLYQILRSSLDVNICCMQGKAGILFSVNWYLTLSVHLRISGNSKEAVDLVVIFYPSYCAL